MCTIYPTSLFLNAKRGKGNREGEIDMINAQIYNWKQQTLNKTQVQFAQTFSKLYKVLVIYTLITNHDFNATTTTNFHY